MPSGIYKRKPRIETEPIHRPFCRRGHSFELVGRTPTGNCRGCLAFRSREWIKKQPGSEEQARRRNNRLVGMHGITLKQRQEMFNKQQGRCAICSRHQSEFRRVLCVDHNHATGKNRSLLCSKCNGALWALENKEFFVKASAYLKSHEEVL
jgi:recombination endonuclease VII